MEANRLLQCQPNVQLHRKAAQKGCRLLPRAARAWLPFTVNPFCLDSLPRSPFVYFTDEIPLPLLMPSTTRQVEGMI